MLQLNEQDQGKRYEIKVGQDLEISLLENPTAGFRWTIIESGTPVCEFLVDRFEPGLQSSGQSGIHFWKFRLALKGQVTIRLAYRRSWESESSTARTVAFRINGQS